MHRARPPARPAYNVERVVGHPLWSTVEELIDSFLACRSLGSPDHGPTSCWDPRYPAFAMVAAPPFPIQPPSVSDERRILLSNVPWSTYVVLRDSLDSSGVRMTYLEGTLEIMSPSREHEVEKKQIARLLELYCLERDIPLYAYGSTTFRREEQERGLEPDECYCRDRDAKIPDVALEVIHTNPLLDKLDVYRALGVREVWIFREGRFSIVGLRGDRFESIATSDVLPEVDLATLAKYAVMPDQHAALRAFLAELRSP